MAPTPPNARSAPGEPVALLDLAPIEGGGPEMAPTPPNARSAPGEPVALLDLALIEGGGPGTAPPPPAPRDAPGDPRRSPVSPQPPARGTWGTPGSGVTRSRSSGSTRAV